MKNQKTVKLVETAIMVGLSVALALISDIIPFLQLPLGGHVTLFSALPIIYIAVKYGCTQGFLAGFCTGLLQLAGGFMKNAAALIMEHWYETVIMLLLDYIVAYTIYGIAGIFKNKGTTAKFAGGSAVALAFRYVCHIISGSIFFGQWAEWFFTDEEELGGTEIGNFFMTTFSGTGLSIAYSVVYNGLYMIPEIILTVIIGFAISKTAFIKKQCEIKEN